MKGLVTDSAEAFMELERGVHAALEMYSNVHRGSGQYSMVSTALFDQAREIVLEHLGLDKHTYVTVFCTPQRLETLIAQLKPLGGLLNTLTEKIPPNPPLGKGGTEGTYHTVSSRDVGLPLGIRALAVARKALPKGIPFQTGGGVVKLVNPHSVVWADAPDKFEAGTPNIVNAIAFAKALQLIEYCGHDVFKKQIDGAATATAAQILYQDEFLQYSGTDLLRELRKTLVGRDVRVPTAEGERSYINLDNAASTPTFAPIWDVVCQTWRQPVPVQQEIVREVKHICAKFLGAPLEEYTLIFTSNTTEALNLVAQSLAGDFVEDTEPVVLNTLLEHHSNELPWRYLSGVSLIRLTVNDEGFIDLDDLEYLLKEYNQDYAHGEKRIRLVAVCGASNVLGIFNDIQAITKIAHTYGARVLVDGAQLVAHRSISMVQDGIDYLAFSGHKMYAPFGSGALVFRKGLLNITELEKMKTSEEENVVGIAAMGKAMTLLQRIGMNIIQDEERILTRRALCDLADIPGIKIFGLHDPDSPKFHCKGGVIVFSLTSTPHNLAAKEFAEQGGIGVRNGCFCAHLIVKHLLRISPFRAFVGEVLSTLASGRPGDLLPGLVRVSFGIENDECDVNHLMQVLEKIASAPRSSVNRLIASTHNGTPFVPHTGMRETLFGKFLENCHTLLSRWSIGITSKSRFHFYHQLNEEVHRRKKEGGLENVYSLRATIYRRAPEHPEKNYKRCLSPDALGLYGDNNLPTNHGDFL